MLSKILTCLDQTRQIISNQSFRIMIQEGVNVLIEYLRGGGNELMGDICFSLENISSFLSISDWGLIWCPFTLSCLFPKVHLRISFICTEENNLRLTDSFAHLEKEALPK